jgi:Arc/MetJ-type ribon-helix-helix transcriptional regulator
MMPRNRETLNATIPPELISWLDKLVEKRIFASRSHGVELCLLEGQKKFGR